MSHYIVSSPVDGVIAKTPDPADAIDSAELYAKGYSTGDSREAAEYMETLRNDGAVTIAGREVSATVTRE